MSTNFGVQSDMSLGNCFTEVEKDNFRFHLLGVRELPDVHLETFTRHVETCNDCQESMRKICVAEIGKKYELSHSEAVQAIFLEQQESPIHRSAPPDLSYCDRESSLETLGLILD